MPHAKIIWAESESNSDMRYAANFAAPDEFVYYASPSGKAAIAVSDMEYDRAKMEARENVEVISLQKLNADSNFSALLAMLRRDKVRIVQTPGSFPLLIAEKLRAEHIDVVPLERPIFPEREYKSAWEIAEIAKAVAVAEAGMKRAFAIIEEAQIAENGMLIFQNHALSSEILRMEIVMEFTRRNASATSTIVSGGKQGAQPHCVGSGPLFAHTPIVLDLFPKLNESGYWGDLTRTVVKGCAPDIVKRAFDAVLQARDFAKTLICAGAVPAEIHHKTAEKLMMAGFDNGTSAEGNYGFFHGLGHGVGLDIHEAPRINGKNTIPLCGGEVITVEPGLYYPQWGGVRIEDMVAVEAYGYADLTTIATFLEIE